MLECERPSPGLQLRLERNAGGKSDPDPEIDGLPRECVLDKGLHGIHDAEHPLHPEKVLAPSGSGKYQTRPGSGIEPRAVEYSGIGPCHRV